MALNKFMHPRNHYKHNRPDFAKLGEKYPDFKKFLSFNDKGKASLDFKDAEALKSLTCTLLKEDFDINLDIPLDHIIPTVPLRLNYIHWLEDLLEGTPNGDTIWGIDIGCGTSCIYPLLGAKINGWHFWALEVDPLALQYAEENVERNHLGDHIRVIENTTDGLFLDLLNSSEHKQRKFHFTMCNPPFFGNILEAQGLLSSRSSDRPEPSSVSTADEGEMIFDGGEVEFVKNMILESHHVTDRVLWFTSMLGKKSSVGQVVAELKKAKVPAWTTTEFCQGRTMRWGVAWSYQRTAKKKHSPGKRKLKEKPPLTIPVPQAYISNLFQKLEPVSTDEKRSRGRQEKVLAVALAMEEIMKKLKMTVKKQVSSKWNPKFELAANKNTWSHQRRKRRQSKSKKRRTGLPHQTESRSAQDYSGSCAASSGISSTHEYSTEDHVALDDQRSGQGIHDIDQSRELSPKEAQRSRKTIKDGCTALTECTKSNRCFMKGSKTVQGEEMFGCTSVNLNSNPSATIGASANDQCVDDGDSIKEFDTIQPCQNNNKISSLVMCADISDKDELHIFQKKEDLLKKRKERHVSWKEDDSNSFEPLMKRRKEDASIQNRVDDTNHHESSLGKESQQSEVTSADVTGHEGAALVIESLEESQTDLHKTFEKSDQKNDDSEDIACEIDKYREDTSGLQRVDESQPPKGSWGTSSGHVHSSICMSSSDPGSGSDADHGPLLKCLLEVKLVSKGSIEVVFSCDSSQSREVLHQVAQYVKNQIAKVGSV